MRGEERGGTVRQLWQTRSESWSRTTAKRHAAAAWELPGLPRTSSTANSAAPSSPREETNEGRGGGWWWGGAERKRKERKRARELPCSPLEPCPLGEEETKQSQHSCLRRGADREGGGEANEERGRGGGDGTAKGTVGEIDWKKNIYKGSVCKGERVRGKTQRKGKAFVSGLNRKGVRGRKKAPCLQWRGQEEG